MEILGLVFAVGLLIWLALRGVDIVFAALACSLVVIISNDLPLTDALLQHFSLGPLGAFTFAGRFFLLFAAGAVFGRVMGDSNAAGSMAMALVRKLGAHRALWVTTLACALLTYGGVVVFVVIFAMYPLGLRLLHEANVPKRLFCAALALGAGTFTLTALPGTPSIQNVIPSVALGTDLFAGFWIGIFAGALMFITGIWYLERQRRLAADLGEGFEPGPRDVLENPDEGAWPHWTIAGIPLVIVLATIILPRVFVALLSPEALAAGNPAMELLRFASGQPVLWPSIALLCGSIVALVLFPNVRRHSLDVLGTGTRESIMPLINTAAVIGFGGVIKQTAGFSDVAAWAVSSDLPPMISMVLSVSVVSAVTGSASGGLQIFMQTLAPSYIEQGMDPQILHRVAAIASGGLDSLPHSGAVVAMLTITQLTHRQAYRDVGIITVVIPVMVTILTLGLVASFY